MQSPAYDVTPTDVTSKAYNVNSLKIFLDGSTVISSIYTDQ